MKIFSILLLSVCLSMVVPVNTIHNYTVPKIEGGNQSLSAYQGKKILVFTLPLTQTLATDSVLYSLDTLATARASMLQVIAVPSYEDGYTVAQKAELQQWYRSKLSSTVLITEGLYTRKTSGTQQHPLFKWLTSVTQNEMFDIDVEGPGFKFFANGSGELYGVLKAQSKISGASVQRTLNMN